jgi:hypothetical protein
VPRPSEGRYTKENMGSVDIGIRVCLRGKKEWRKISHRMTHLDENFN